MSSDSEESLSDLVDSLAKPTKSEPAPYRHSYDQLGDETDDHDDDSDLESTARPAPRKRTTHDSEEQPEQRQQPRKKARSSSPKRQPFREPYYFPESHQTFAREIQHRIQGLVMRGDYEDAWKLLCSIVETDKIPIISFFEVSL